MIVWQKSAQYCKTTIFQLKINKKFKSDKNEKKEKGRE